MRHHVIILDQLSCWFLTADQLTYSTLSSWCWLGHISGRAQCECTACWNERKHLCAVHCVHQRTLGAIPNALTGWWTDDGHDSLDMLRKMELVSIMDRVRELPIEFFRCSADTLECGWRGWRSKRSKTHGEMRVFKILHWVLSDCSLPISNLHIKRAFSQVALLNDNTRKRMGVSLLSSPLEVCATLSRNGWSNATFRPPQQLLERFNSLMYK